MSIAFMFAGQGAQKVGMGRDLYETYDAARSVFDSCSLPFDIKEICFHDQHEMLQDTTYVQPCLLTTSIAIANVLKEKGIQPAYVLGLSLGEYSALTFADAMSLSDAQQMVYQRGLIMSNALPKQTSGMLAVLQLETDKIKHICSQVYGICEIANYNCPGQVVISGELHALQEASELCLQAGARRIIPLRVSGAFHSSLLMEASEQFRTVLNQYELKNPSIPVIYNVSGCEEQGDIKDLLCRQMRSSVHFEQSIRYAILKGVDIFIEIGPGTALAGFVKKISKDVLVMSVEDEVSMKSVMEVIQHDEN